ncbi:FkbM family methyltransferase [Candidatus Uhrbacteria bacterium]|nr:FkbM family methyltransferase [Candidatus Uhrbacteria bacterium]
MKALINKVRHLFFYGFGQGVKSGYHALRYFIARDVFKKPFFRRPIFNYEMYIDLKDPGISKELAIFGQRELEHRYILRELLKPNMTVWDLGANIGYYAIMEAKFVGKQGKVYAAEPSPSNVEFLRKNIVLNRCESIVEVSPVGISNRNGEAEFFLSEMSNVNTFHPLTNSGERAAHLTGKAIMVPIMDVPTFIKGKRLVDLVRMDIEGHEVEVFESIARAVKEQNFSASILFETHFPKYDDASHNMRAQLSALFSLGYTPAIIASTDERKAKFREYGYVPERLIKTDGVVRGLYKNVSKDVALKFICDFGGVRTVLLERKV